MNKEKEEHEKKTAVLGLWAIIGPMVRYALAMIMTETIHSGDVTYKRVPGRIDEYQEVGRKWNPGK